MFTGLMSKVALGLGIALLLLGAGFGVYFWYAEGKIDGLNKKNGQLELAVKTQTEAITAMTQQYSRQNAEISSLQKKTNAAENRRKELEARFRLNDLEKDSKTNRIATEQSINKDTDDAFKQLETITGSAGVTPTTPPATKLVPKSATSSGDNVQPPPAPPKRNSK